MSNSSRITALALSLFFALGLQTAFAAGVDGLSTAKSQADLDAIVATTGDAALKQALRDNAAAILAASEQRPHVEAIIKTLEIAPGKFEKINTTPESLKKVAGGDVALFDTLKMVDLAVPTMGPHDRRTIDPFDAAFFEHLGHITSLESLNIISTKASDDWIAPLAHLTNLTTLKFTNNGKLTDAGLEHLAGLKQLETFAFVGTEMKGHAFARFDGWTKLKHSSFRGSSLDDEGLRLMCEQFPNYESLSLAHAKFTDAGAASLAKLTKLKGLEIGTHNATPQCLRYLTGLPLEYLQLGEGFEGPQAIVLIKDFKSLNRLTLTNAKGLTNADLKLLTGMKQLQSLELNNVELTDQLLPELQSFTFLKSLRLVRRPQGYPADTQAKIKAMLPGVALTFE